MQSKTVLTDIFLGGGTFISRCKKYAGITLVFAIGFLLTSLIIEEKCKSRCLEAKSKSNMFRKFLNPM
jgi:hypothetical protein